MSWQDLGYVLGAAVLVLLFVLKLKSYVDQMKHRSNTADPHYDLPPRMEVLLATDEKPRSLGSHDMRVPASEPQTRQIDPGLRQGDE